MKRPDLRELTEMSVLAALTFAGKVAMASLPNIEPVSLMIMLMTVIYGRKALYPIYVYVMLEMLVYGFNLWNLVYLYIWLFLAVPAYFMRPVRQRLPWAILSGAFGLLFGKGVFAQYQAEGEAFLPKYDKLLAYTGQDDVREVAASVGIDVTDVNFWRASLKVEEEAINEMEKLVNELYK